MNLKDIIEGLVNSEDDTGCDGGLTVVEKKYVEQLRKYLDSEYKSQKEQKRKESLKDAREKIAQECFEEDDLDGLECVEQENWEADGNYYNKKFYYRNEENPDGDSKVATFVVIFKENSTKLIDAHVNIW